MRIDGKDRGGLPLAASMSPGSHRLEVSAAGRIPFASDISVPEDRDLDLLLHLEGRRSRANRLVFYGLLGSAGAAAATGALFGLLALDDESAFAKDPTPALGARGERRAEISDVSFGLALGLAGGAVLWHFLTRPGASTARIVY